MNVDTMRKVDRFVGIPLCFCLQLFYGVRELFAKPDKCKPRNVLLIELSEMGSAILVDPAMRKLQKQGDCELHFVIFKSNVASLQILKTVSNENIFTIRNDNLVTLALDSLAFLGWCRKKQIDTVIDLEMFSRFTALLNRLSGAVNRVGFQAFHDEGLYRGNFLTRPVLYNSHQHISRNFIALANAALSEVEEHPFSKQLVHDDEVQLMQVQSTDHDLAVVDEKIRSLYASFSKSSMRIVLINPNASELLPQRRWMADRYARVITGLLQRFDDVLVVITGAPGEREQAEALRIAVNHERCVNSAGVFAFAELVPLYNSSRLMLTNDSGPGHFSAVTALRTFVIFGPETPALYGSLGNSTPIYAGLSCSPCVSASNHRKTSCTDNQCLKAISPESVLAQLDAELSQPSS